MSFWSGIGKIFEGIDEAATGVIDAGKGIAFEAKVNRLKKYSGQYKVDISLTEPNRKLIALITYHAPVDVFDTDHISLINSNEDVWDTLADSEKYSVNSQIREYLPLILQGRLRKLEN